MLSLFNSKPPPGPAETVIYAVGDIHGRSDLLHQLVAMIRADIAHAPEPMRPVVVFLGDYIDRGPDSRSVIDLIITLKQDPTWIVETLRGNHEQFLIDFLETGGSAGTAGWLDHGGRDTFASYGVAAPLHRLSSEENEVAAGELSSAMPDSHRRFLDETALSVTHGSYLFVHAGVKPGRPMDRQTADDLLTIRGPFLRSGRPLKNTVVVFGHTVFDKPYLQRWKIGIDTGAYASGRLTALKINGPTLTFLST